MVKIHFDRVLPYDATRLWEMVGDVSKYPDYIPWFTFMHVSNLSAIDDDTVRFDAEAGVGFKFLSERFTTRITRNRARRTIDVILLKGPFKRLNAQWKFTEDPKGARIDFDIEFEFKNPFLEGFLKANFDKAVSKLMACFEGRAATLYPKAV
jgi:coenzyme Q-binding protein COQ10